MIGAWRPTAINNAGDVIGNGVTNFYPDGPLLSIADPELMSVTGQAFFWHQGVTTNLASFDGNATQVAHINDSSTVAGWSEGRGKNPHAVVWKPGQSQLVDLGVGPRGLNQLGAIATAINARETSSATR